MTRIAYITKLNFSTEKAHAHTMAKTCEALAKQPDVTLMLVSSDGSAATSEARAVFLARHDITHPFPVISLGAFGWSVQNRSAFAFRLASISAQFALMRWIYRNRRNIDVLYARDHLLPLPLLFAKYVLRKQYVFECHFVLTKKFGQRLTEFLVRRASGAVAITEGLASYYRPMQPHVTVAYCAASEPERYDVSKEAVTTARASFNVPTDATVIGYTGNMNVTGNGDPYGIEDIIRALPLLLPHVFFVGVGKKEGETLPAEALARKLGVSDRARFLPWIARNDVGAYVLAADILVVPASGAQIGNSPTKVFEYLASGRPIVAANTGPIAEVLHDGVNALVVDYTKPEAWKEAILRLMNDAALRERLVKQAGEDAKGYTWESRGKHIADFLHSL